MRNNTLWVLFVLFCFGSIAGTAYADVWEKEWIVPANAQVYVKASKGNIRVDGGDVSQVKAVVRTVGWRIADDEVKVTANRLDDRIELEVKLLTRRYFWQVSNQLNIELTVPRSVSLDLHTDDGNLRINGSGGAVRADTRDGDIETSGGKGTVRLYTRDGNINARELDGAVTAETGDGNINLDGRLEGLDIRTGDGNLSATAQTGSRVALPWKMSTGDGNLILRMPDGVGAELDITTGSGRIITEFPGAAPGKKGLRVLRGPMNGGGQQLYMHTRDGNIDIIRH